MSTGLYQQKNELDIGAVANSMQASPKFRSTNPHGGRRLSVSGEMSDMISQSFGLNADEIDFRESSDARRVGGRAFAQGNTINFAPGEFRPETREGREVLGHELHHIREQARDDLRPNIPGSNILYDSSREAASDRAGRDFAAGNLSAQGDVSLAGVSADGAPAQGFVLTTAAIAAIISTIIAAGGGLTALAVLLGKKHQAKLDMEDEQEHYESQRSRETDAVEYGTFSGVGDLAQSVRDEVDEDSANGLVHGGKEDLDDMDWLDAPGERKQAALDKAEAKRMAPILKAEKKKSWRQKMALRMFGKKNRNTGRYGLFGRKRKTQAA